MANGLATRCPACSTVFRIVPDQLRVSEGWVRCGRCSEVFDASQSLTDIDTGEARRLVGDPARPLAPLEPSQPFRAPPPDRTEWVVAEAEPDSDPATEPEPEPEPDTDPADPAVIDFSAGESSVLPEMGFSAVAVAAAELAGPRAEPADRPSFVVQAERAERWRRPRVRALLLAALLLSSAGLLAQLGFEYRDQVAARFPAARPLLEQACGALGCTVEAARAIDSLAVDSSGLVRVERSSVYRLQVVLKNRSAIELALPALDLSLTDSQGRLIARKVVRVAELGSAQATIGAGREIALLATLQAAAAAPGAPAPEPIAGYTIDLFYP